MELHTVSPPGGLHPGRCDERSQDSDRLVGRSEGRSARVPASGRSRMSRASRRCWDRRFRRTRPAGVAALQFLGDASGDAPLPRHQAGAPFRRRRSAAGRGARDRDCAARYGGDLGAASARAGELPDARGSRGTKLRTPVDFVVASVRALETAHGHRPDAGRSWRSGSADVDAPAPDGWPDTRGGLGGTGGDAAADRLG